MDENYERLSRGVLVWLVCCVESIIMQVAGGAGPGGGHGDPRGQQRLRSSMHSRGSTNSQQLGGGYTRGGSSQSVRFEEENAAHGYGDDGYDDDDLLRPHASRVPPRPATAPEEGLRPSMSR